MSVRKRTSVLPALRWQVSNTAGLNHNIFFLFFPTLLFRVSYTSMCAVTLVLRFLEGSIILCDTPLQDTPT